MIPLIRQALLMGYTATRILNFFTKKVPGMERGLDNARSQGHSDQNILNFLQGKIPHKNPKGSEKYSNELDAYLSENGIDTKEERAGKRNRAIKTAIGATGTAVTAYMAYNGYPEMAQGLKNVLGGRGGPEPMGGAPIQPDDGGEIIPVEGETIDPTRPPEGPIEPEQPPEPNLPTQEEVDTLPDLQPDFDVLKRNDLVPKIQTMVKAGKSKEGIVSFIKKKLPMMEQERLRSLGKKGEFEAGSIDEKLGSMVDRFFLGGQQQPEVKQPEQEEQPVQVSERQSLIPEQPIQIEEEQTVSPIAPLKIETPKTVAKGDTVVTKDGNVANVKGISGKNFLIEENGKMKQVPMESLRAEPEAIKNAKIVFDPSSLPEEDRSAALALSIPLPDRSGIIQMFHNGDFYLYKNKNGKPIEESIVRRIIDGTDHPLTTGSTFMGMYNTEKGDSRGSASFKELTSQAQSAEQIAEGDDPSKPLVFDKIKDSYTHIYIKEFMQLLKEASRQFGAKTKKQRKKKA